MVITGTKNPYRLFILAAEQWLQQLAGIRTQHNRFQRRRSQFPKFVKILGVCAQPRAPRSEAGSLCEDGCELLNIQSGSQNRRIMDQIRQREISFCLFFYGVKRSKCKMGRISSKRSRQTNTSEDGIQFSLLLLREGRLEALTSARSGLRWFLTLAAHRQNKKLQPEVFTDP